MDHQLKLAAQILLQGGLVAFPTETVYGLGACINKPSAIQKVFTVKQRPENHPLIVHIASIDQLEQVAINIPHAAYILAQNFWPGALTLILEKHPSIPEIVTASQPTVGIRIPQHPLTLKLLTELNTPLVGPSANSFGKLSPTSALHVKKDLGNKIDLILDGGECSIGIESTILSLVNPEQPTILRPGKITAEQISQVLNNPVNMQLNAKPGAQVSGQLAAHYQPNKPLYIIKQSDFAGVLQKLASKNLRPLILNINTNTPNAFAQELYAKLHLAESAACDCILLAATPTTPDWLAINDRLRRASSLFID